MFAQGGPAATANWMGGVDRHDMPDGCVVNSDVSREEDFEKPGCRDKIGGKMRIKNHRLRGAKYHKREELPAANS